METVNLCIPNLKKENPDAINDLWVFGYGSLIWKVDFPIAEKKSGYIEGFVRRFYQNSIDHRGRVVTLIPSETSTDRVWGMAYRIDPNDRDCVMNHLDDREINGYTRYAVNFYPFSVDDDDATGTPECHPIVLYVATSDNDSFAGASTMSEIVDQIHDASGKSGTNREYVYNLANAMRQLFPNQNDEHLFTLETMLRDRESQLLMVQ